MQRGRLIYIEGGEGCGKGTQTKLLLTKLQQQGIACVHGREPGGVHLGEEIRNLLLDPRYDINPTTELFLFEAARAEYFNQFVIPKRTQGITVVSDRSGLSTLAYQGFAGGLDLSLIERINKAATFETDPDRIFILDVPPEKGLAKEVEPDRFAAKGIEYHRKVNDGYRSIAARYANASLIPYAEGQPETMHEQIWAHTRSLFNL